MEHFAELLLLLSQISYSFGENFKQAVIVTKKNNTVVSEEVLIGFIESCKGTNNSQTNSEELELLIQKVELLLIRQSRVEELLRALQPNDSRQG